MCPSTIINKVLLCWTDLTVYVHVAYKVFLENLNRRNHFESLRV